MNDLLQYANEKLDIIVVAGQSNAEGCGAGEVQNPFVPNPNILWLWDDFGAHYEPNGDGTDRFVYNQNPSMYICQAKELEWDNQVRGNIGLIFARNYLQKELLEDGRKILVLFAPVGGTGFGREQWGVGNVLYNRLVNMTKCALELNPQNRLIAFLWHQGEADACGAYPSEKQRYDFYFDSLSTMLDDYCHLFHCQDIPIVAGRFCNEWYLKNKVPCDTVLDALQSVITGRGGIVVETADLQCNNDAIGNGDDIHFCRKDTYVLGNRYFDAYLKIAQTK